MTAYQEQVQEREVRLTAQRILTAHLRPAEDRERPVETFWAGIHLDLSSATLINFRFARCVVGGADFASARFLGRAGFVAARFISLANFPSATFIHLADFETASFAGNADFQLATFGECILCRSDTFEKSADFRDTEFAGGRLSIRSHSPWPWTEFNYAHFKDGNPKELTPFLGADESDESASPV